MARSTVISTRIIAILIALLLACFGVAHGLSCYKCGQYNDGVGSITPCINYTATQLKECPSTSQYCIPLENFTIENNILKGVDLPFDDYRDLSEILLETLNGEPDHVGQIEAETGKCTTFAEMKERSVRCALWMKKEGIGHGDIVTMCTHNHLDTCTPIFATFFTGAIYNAWNYQNTLIPARHLMKLFKPKIIFSSESAVDVLLEAASLENVSTKIIVFGKHPKVESFDDIVKIPTKIEVENYRPEKIKNKKDVAIIVLSSGSTGFPKGVMHSRESIVKILQSFSVTACKGNYLLYSTCYWITGLLIMLQICILRGVRIIHANFDPEETCKIIEKYKVNGTLLTPVAATYLCKSGVLKKYNLSSLNNVMTGGSKINPKILQEFRDNLPNAFVFQVYGMSETGRFSLGQTENCKSLDSAGFPASVTQIKIRDLDTDESLGPNQHGELCFKVPTLMIGYYKNEEETKKAIDEDGWLHSGDKAYYDENGEVFIVDRLKDVMKYQNHQVSPVEIEEVLLSHPSVMEVSVVAKPHPVDGDHPMAFVKKVPGSNVTETELVELSTILGETKKLRGGVRFLEELPKTPSEAWSTRTYCCKEDGCNGAPVATSTSLWLTGVAFLLVPLVQQYPLRG